MGASPESSGVGLWGTVAMGLLSLVVLYGCGGGSSEPVAPSMTGVFAQEPSASAPGPTPSVGNTTPGLLGCNQAVLPWAVETQSCSGTLAGAASGALSVAADNAGPSVGSARFACRDGIWSAPDKAVCASPLVVEGSLPGLSPLPHTTLSLVSSPAPVIPPAEAATIQAVVDGPWSSASTWGGRLPREGDIVLVPKNRTVELAGPTPRLNGLWVLGNLMFGGADVSLNTRYAMVFGRLQAGSEMQPYLQRAVIELWGSDSTHTVMGMGTKLLGVMAGGVLKLHGEQRLAWTQLNASAPAGSTSVQLKDDASTWRVGDQLVIAASDIDPRKSEVVTITAVSGRQLNFTPALVHPRFALVQTFEGKTLDQRPTVGLLSRNILIRGASDSDANAFGGHVMGMAGGEMQVSGVEFQRMGQRGFSGRYPMHWHQAGDRRGNYLIASSVNRSFQRAAVLHSTNQVLLDANVAYDVRNHAFVWAEDGDEVGNQLTRNVGILVRSPEQRHFAFPINNPFFGNSSQGENRSAVFWGRSLSKHLLRGNVSGGAIDGFGYFVDLFTPAPKSTTDGEGMIFEGNVAHSTFKTLATGNQINYPEATTSHALMVTTGAGEGAQMVFSNYTAFFNTSGAWLEDRATVLKDSIVADNGIGVIVLRGVVDGVTVVSKSRTQVDVPRVVPSVSQNVSPGIQVAGSNHGGQRAPLIRNSTVINNAEAGILWDTDNILPLAKLENVRFVNTPNRIVLHEPSGFEFADPPNFGLHDQDGVILGDGKPARVMLRDAILANQRCNFEVASNGIVCPAADSLVLRSTDQPLSLVEANGQMTFLRRFNLLDPSMPPAGAISLVGNGRRYAATGVQGARLDLVLEDAAGKSVEITFGSASGPSQFVHAGRSVAAAPSLAAMRGSGASSYFYNAADRKLVVKLVGGNGVESVRIDAQFAAPAFPGKMPDPLPAGAIDGYSYLVKSGTARKALRYGEPIGPVTRSGTADASRLDRGSSATALRNSASGDTTVLRAWVFAPQDGVYRVGLWGEGGGTSLWFGENYQMGEPWAFINSNYVAGNSLRSDFQHWQPNRHIALKTGWHEIAMVHAKMPENRQNSELHLRWTTPTQPNQWTYPQIRRAP